MAPSDWERARSDLEFARQKAKAYHDALTAAFNLSPQERRRLRELAEYLRKQFHDDADGVALLSFLEELGEDVHSGISVRDTVYFLTNVAAFLPRKGRPPKDGLQAAVFWLMLNYSNRYPDEMGLGVSTEFGGTQNQNSKLVDWLQSEFEMIGIKERSIPYQFSSIHHAASQVKESPQWNKATAGIA